MVLKVTLVVPVSREQRDTQALQEQMVQRACEEVGVILVRLEAKDHQVLKDHPEIQEPPDYLVSHERANLVTNM
jgi:transcriptional regulator of aromatic amino acid metabolism